MNVPPLDAAQQHIFDCVVRDIKAGRQEIKIGGLAGTGKTVLARYLLERFDGWACCAYTGKATDVLRRKGVSRAQTIHSLIYQPYKNREGKLRFRKKESISVPGILVDEASMVGLWEYRDLMSFGYPVIYIGDMGQIPPPKGNMDLMKHPHYTLTKLHRNAGEIAHLCHWAREGKPIRQFPAEKRVKFIDKRQMIPANMVKVDQILCARNKTRVAINADVRNYLGYTQRLHEGEKIICLRNNKDAGLFNGMMGHVLRVRDGEPPEMDIDVFGDQYTGVDFAPEIFGTEQVDMDNYEPGDPNWFDYARAITVHKAQGSEFDSQISIVENVRRFCDQRKHDYTNFSRARKYLYIYEMAA